jgi:hypothetical protein
MPIIRHAEVRTVPRHTNLCSGTVRKNFKCALSNTVGYLGNNSRVKVPLEASDIELGSVFHRASWSKR